MVSSVVAFNVRNKTIIGLKFVSHRILMDCLLLVRNKTIIGLKSILNIWITLFWMLEIRL